MNVKSMSERQVTTLEGERSMLALCAVMAGTALIFLVGFAPMSAVHNAAHDTRHTAGYPCH